MGFSFSLSDRQEKRYAATPFHDVSSD